MIMVSILLTVVTNTSLGKSIFFICMFDPIYPIYMRYITSTVTTLVLSSPGNIYAQFWV